MVGVFHPASKKDWSFYPLAQAFHLTKREMLLIQAAAHPLVGLADIFLFAGMVSIVYLLEFIHRQAALEPWKSALIVFCGYFIILASRVVFIP